jgi:hypothetical protein
MHSSHRGFLVWTIAALALAGTPASLLPGAELPAEVAKEREWGFADQGEFTGTLVGIEQGKARIRMSDGVVREFDPGWSKGGSAAALRRAMCRIPPVRPWDKARRRCWRCRRRSSPKDR